MTKYKKVTPEIAAQLQAIVGAKRFFAGDAVKDDFSHDEMPIYGKYYPEVVCEAESTEEVSAILRVCYENDIPVTPRGAGTGLVGGCVPLCGGVVLCTTRMNKILSYDMNNLVVHIQPGVLLCDLAADALTRGLMYPPDPGEKTATVGGNVSTNAGGMRAVKYGVTRDYVLAMTVVLPDGRVMELGKTVCKTSSGYSLLHLMIGSEGTLGVITELTLKLIPKPEMNVSLILPFADVETAIASVPQIKLANLDPQSIEFMERDIVDSSAAFTGNTIFPTVVNGKEAGAYILVTLVGDSEAELTAKMDRLGALAEQRGAYDTLVVWTDGLKMDVWAARSAFLTVIEADTKLLDEMDVVVPVDRIAEFLVYTQIRSNRLFIGRNILAILIQIRQICQIRLHDDIPVKAQGRIQLLPGSPRHSLITVITDIPVNDLQNLISFRYMVLKTVINLYKQLIDCCHICQTPLECQRNQASDLRDKPGHHWTIVCSQHCCRPLWIGIAFLITGFTLPHLSLRKNIRIKAMIHLSQFLRGHPCKITVLTHFVDVLHIQNKGRLTVKIITKRGCRRMFFGNPTNSRHRQFKAFLHPRLHFFSIYLFLHYAHLSHL